MRYLAFAVLALAAVPGAASAQLSNYNPNGGYTTNRPGQLPTYPNSALSGGNTYQTPGYSTTQMPNGGYVVQNPGQVPSYVDPINPNPLTKPTFGH